MGNSGSDGKDHWSSGPGALRDLEKIRTMPTNRKPVEPPVKVDTAPSHVGVTSVSKEVELGKGGYMRFDGPNGEFGAKKTPNGGFKMGAQTNLGGVSLGHKNKDHDVSMGLSLGKGPGGVEIHGGEMPGMTVSLGPVTATGRHKALAQPTDLSTYDMLQMGNG